MLSRIWQALTEPHSGIRAPAGMREARFMAALYVVMIPSAIIALTVESVVSPSYLPAAIRAIPGVLLFFYAWRLARTTEYRKATWLTIGLGLALPTMSVLGEPGNGGRYGYMLIAPILSAALLGQRVAASITFLTLALTVALVAWNADELGPGQPVTVAIMMIIMGAVVVLAAGHREGVEHLRRRQLESNARRQSALLEAGFGGMGVLNEQGEILECSRGFAAIFGYRSDEMLGKALEQFLEQSGQATGAREAVHRDGRIFPVELVLLPYQELGEARQAVALRDTTEHRRMQAQLHQADRMATMGQLAAGVAHEINNPLAWVLGNLDMLSEELDGEHRTVALRAAEGARRVGRIVADLRTFSRTREPEPTAVDLTRAVRSAVNMVRHQLRDRGLLIEDYAHVPFVDGDETRIGQVCLNLLVNASEALPPGQRSHSQVQVRLYTNDSGDAVLEVADNGPGIPHDIRHRMFEPFFTTKDRGTGLGLSITRSITASLGGRIEVESLGGIGTTMRVVFPPGLLAPAVNETIEKDITSSNRDIDGRRRILIVDDEVDIVELIAAVLDEPDIHTAGSSDEALELLEQRQFDLILCDLMMPEKTGMDLHDEAIRRWPALAGRFAFVTGGAYTDEARRFLDQTQAPVLHKPFKLTRLRELVAGMLNRKPTTTE